MPKLTQELADFLKGTGRDSQDTIGNIAGYYHILPDKLRGHYKKHSCGCKDWNQKNHTENYMLYPRNKGEQLNIDEISLSKVELYTFTTNKKGRSKQGTIVASIMGTRSEDIIEVLEKLPMDSRKKVWEITLDMSRNMESAVRPSFPEATLATDIIRWFKPTINQRVHV